MKVSVEKTSGVERKVIIEVPWETVREELEVAYRDLGKRAKVKGFRPGKVPRRVLEKMYRKAVEGEVVNQLVDDGFRRAVEQEDLFPIDRPRLDAAPSIEADSPLTFAALVEVKPEVEVKSWKGLKLEKAKVTVDDASVDAELQQLREKAVVVEQVTDREEVQDSDMAVVDFFGFVDGESFKGGKGINYTVEVGSGSMIPGFEDALIGMKIGDHKEFQLGFPENTGPDEVRGKEVDWKVDLKEIKQKIYPDLDDEFAKDLGEFDSLAELKDKIRENVATREEARSRHGLRDAALKALVEANPTEVPKVMVDRQLDSTLADTERALQSNPDPKLKDAIAKLKEDLRPQAEVQVAGMLLLEGLCRTETIEVGEDEIEGKIQELAQQHNMQPKQVKQQLRQNDQMDSLRYSIEQDKALDMVVEAAQVVEVDPPAEEDAPASED
ncbi:MAG: trigger factor [Myxococcota bacterium]